MNPEWKILDLSHGDLNKIFSASRELIDKMQPMPSEKIVAGFRLVVNPALPVTMKDGSEIHLLILSGTFEMPMPKIWTDWRNDGENPSEPPFAAMALSKLNR
jgi:hypothetical protein